MHEQCLKAKTKCVVNEDQPRNSSKNHILTSKEDEKVVKIEITISLISMSGLLVMTCLVVEIVRRWRALRRNLEGIHIDDAQILPRGKLDLLSYIFFYRQCLLNLKCNILALFKEQGFMKKLNTPLQS